MKRSVSVGQLKPHSWRRPRTIAACVAQIKRAAERLGGRVDLIHRTYIRYYTGPDGKQREELYLVEEID